MFAQVNDTELGLASYVYADRLQDALRIAERIDAGMVGINRGVVSDPAAPVGGFKQSGLGREGARDGIREYQETQYFSVKGPDCLSGRCMPTPATRTGSGPRGYQFERRRPRRPIPGEPSNVPSLCPHMNTQTSPCARVCPSNGVSGCSPLSGSLPLASGRRRRSRTRQITRRLPAQGLAGRCPWDPVIWSPGRGTSVACSVGKCPRTVTALR
jgi:hypothetical protein